MRSLRFSTLLVLCAALPGAALPGAALAQQTTPTSPDTGHAPAAGDQPTLSEKLNKTDGVIAPPQSGDAEITQKLPNVGTMPVIPPQAVTPPGQPPGAPKPEPK